jgi:hypothetical protein
VKSKVTVTQIKKYSPLLSTRDYKNQRKVKQIWNNKEQQTPELSEEGWPT